MESDNVMEIKKIGEYAPQLIEGLGSGGAFMTVMNGDEKNTMTIGWGTVGIIWGKPILMVAVRYSRHTYQLVEKSGEFTVSIPAAGKLKGALGFCGSKSGRDYDKFAECKLATAAGREIDTPVIDGCELVFECEVVYQQAMEPACLDEGIKKKYYTGGDYHVLYYGEILASYQVAD